MSRGAAPTGSRRISPENYYVSLNDMLVGILFIFILLLTTYALNFKAREDQMSALYKARLGQRADLIKTLRQQVNLPPPRLGEAEDGILRFDEKLLFKQGQAVLKPEGQALLRKLGKQMEKELPCYVSTTAPLPCKQPKAILEAVYVEGHTDSSPFAPGARDNWVLSSERAIAAYRALIGSMGSTGKHPLETLRNARGKENLIGISGYADRRKIDLKSDDPNRRVDLRFVLAAPSSTEQATSSGQP